MKRFPRRVQGLIAELRRRKVFRVVSAYCVVAWAVAQVAELFFPAFHLPPWTVTFVLVMAILGLPVAVVLSWAYDVIPDTGGEALPDAGAAALPSTGTVSAPPPPPAWQPVPPLPVTPPPAGEGQPGLPVRSTPFVGREAERMELRAQLSGGCRLVTIIGAGGLGKTRLALEVARDLEPEFDDGAYFIQLDSLHDAGAVAATVAEQLGIWLTDNGDPVGQIVEFLRAKRCLLVFDNFEHVMEAADVVATILRSAPFTRAIVTSRERLKLHGEAVFPLEGLRLQPASGDTGARSDAVHLFVQGARLADPHFSPTREDEAQIGRIVELVEGMPLAIELASAWIRVLPCSEIVREIRSNREFLSTSLRDVPDRHRSLHAVFDGSWRMLSEVERRVLRRLSVFRGGFTRESASAVAGAALDTLVALVDKSLVHRTERDRFDVLVVLRQHAEAHLREDPQEEAWTRRSHCDYFARLLERYREEQRTSGGTAPLDRIAVDIENIRHATYWAIAQRDYAKLSGAVDSMFAFFDVRGRAMEGEEQFRRAIDAITELPGAGPDAGGRDAILRKLRARQGAFLLRLSRYAEAQRLLEDAAAAARAERDPQELTFCLEKLATAAYEMGDYATAQQRSEECIGISRERGDMSTVAGALIALGNVALAQGDAAAAKGFYEESLTLQQDGDRSGVWVLLCNLGSIAAMQGRLGEARILLERSLAAARAEKNSRGIANTLINLGCLAADSGDLQAAREHLGECLATCQRMGYRSLACSCLVEFGSVEYRLGNLGEAATRYRDALAIAVSGHQTPLILEVFVSASQILIDEGEQELAGDLLRGAAQHPAGDQNIRERATSLLQTRLPARPGDGAELATDSPPAPEAWDVDAAATLLLDRLARLETVARI